MAQISHDAFARTSLHREVVHPRSGGEPLKCDECGNTRQNGRLFQYRTVQDDVGERWAAVHKGLFCSKGCHDAFHS